MSLPSAWCLTSAFTLGSLVVVAAIAEILRTATRRFILQLFGRRHAVTEKEVATKSAERGQN